MSKEFFWTPWGSRLMVSDLEADTVLPFDPETHSSLAKFVDKKVKQDYPDTYENLCRIYGDCAHMYFARANRFLKCNFSINDHQPDIDEDGNFILERVPCPLRGECKDNICSPKLATWLTDREIEVVKLHVEGLSQTEIGERLYIAERTVHNHITRIYSKLGFTGKSSPDKLLISWAYKYHIV